MAPRERGLKFQDPQGVKQGSVGNDDLSGNFLIILEPEIGKNVVIQNSDRSLGRSRTLKITDFQQFFNRRFQQLDPRFRSIKNLRKPPNESMPL